MTTPTAARLTLHWLDRSRSQRILWLFEELSLPYKVVTYKRLPDQQSPASLKGIHPLGKSPVLEITREGWKKPLVLAESANIIEYVASHFGKHLIPQKWKAGEKEEVNVEGEVGQEAEEWMRYRYFMNYAEGSLMALIGIGALKNGIKNAPVPFFLKPITSKISGMLETSYLNHNYDSHFSYLESFLASTKAEISTSSSNPASEKGELFICGPNLTAADFMMVFPLEAAQQIAGLTEVKYPLLTEYVRRSQAREAYKKAIERIIEATGSFEAGI